MVIIVPYRPKLKNVLQESPHVVNATVGIIDVESLDASIEGEFATEPDFFVSNDGNNANSGTSQAAPWQTITKVNSQNFSAGTVIAFRRGDTFSDAILTADQAGSAGGGHVEYRDYGSGNKPKLGSTSLSGAADVTANYVRFRNLHFLGTNGNAGSDIVDVTAANFEAIDVDMDPASWGGTTDGKGYHFESGATDFLIQGGSINNINTSGVTTANGVTGTVQGVTFGTYGVGGGSGDAIQIFNTSGAIAILEDTFDNPSATNGEQSIDVKGGTGHLIARNRFIRARQGHLVIHDPDGAATLADVDVEGNVFLNTDTVRGRVGDFSDSGVVVRFTRNVVVVDSAETSRTIRLGSGAAPDTVSVTSQANVYLIPAGSTAPTIILLREGSWLSDNDTYIALNGATHLLQGDGGFGSGTGVLRLRNAILYNSAGRLITLSNSGVTKTGWAHVLYERADQTTDWFSISGSSATAESHIGTTAPVDDSDSASGDPDFASTDTADIDTDDLASISYGNFALPNAGSPALNLGDTAFAPDEDLTGTSYDDPPNAGSREGNA